MPDDKWTKYAKPANGDKWEQYTAPAASAPPEAPEPEGFFHSLGSSVGVTPEAGEAQADELRQHPVKSLIKAAAGPALPLAQGLYEGAKRSGGELLDAGSAALHGDKAGAIYHGVKAVPIIGPGMDKATDQYADKDYSGAAGTLLGTAAQTAPILLGGADAIASDRPLVGQIPSRARAGEMFNSLNKDLADHPVNLKSSVAPLQRSAEIGVRGSSLPKPVSDLLGRSQAVEPMTFPEARDYQSSLSDLSASDKMGMNKRMGGSVSQLSKGLYQDLLNSAEEAGRDGDYAKAMKEFRQASQLRDMTIKGVKTGLGLAGLGVAGHYAGKLLPETR